MHPTPNHTIVGRASVCTAFFNITLLYVKRYCIFLNVNGVKRNSKTHYSFIYDYYKMNITIYNLLLIRIKERIGLQNSLLEKPPQTAAAPLFSLLAKNHPFKIP